MILLRAKGRTEMEIAEITDFDREWVREMAGRDVLDQEVVEFLRDFNNWLDSQEISPAIFSGN